MKAAVIREFGTPDVLKYEEVNTPTPGEGEVLIKILATGVNRLEHYLREGSVLPELPFPHILGSDAAGVIEAVGPDAWRFSVGDRVIPMPGYPRDSIDDEFKPLSAAPSYAIGGIFTPGAYAEYMVVPEQWVVADTTGLQPEEVATVPMTLVTGVRAVKVVGGVKQGDSVLVHAGGSGTGSMSIQIAKVLGARVATTVQGPEQAAFAKALGADLVIDVIEEDFVEKVLNWTNGLGADVVIDNLGGDILGKSVSAVRPLGVVVAMGFVAGVEANFHVRNFFFAHKQIRGTLMGDVDDMTWGLELLRQRKIKPQLDRTIRLHDAAEAHRLIAENGIRGNLVLVP